MGFIDVLRGRYNSEVMKKKNMTRDDVLKTSVNEMTVQEKNDILEKSFDELWDNVWLNKLSRVYRNEKIFAERHFKENYNRLK
jgi:hypothetical protein